KWLQERSTCPAYITGQVSLSFPESSDLDSRRRKQPVNGRPVLWAIRNEQDFWIGSIGFKDFTIGKSHLASRTRRLPVARFYDGSVGIVAGTRRCTKAHSNSLPSRSVTSFGNGDGVSDLVPKRV